MVFFASEIKNPGDVDVFNFRGSACLLLKLLSGCRIDTRDRNKRQGNGVTRSFVDSFVSNDCAGSRQFPRSTLAAKRDAVVLKESSTLHIRAAARGTLITFSPAALSFNFDFRDELLRPHEAQAFYAGYPAWIRTKNNASKERCFTR